MRRLGPVPGSRLVWVVDGGLAAVSLARACVQHHVVMVSRLRGQAAVDDPPGPPPPGQRGRQPWQGQRQRRWQG